MARNWFYEATTIGADAADLQILNRAARHLVDHHDMSPSVRWLSCVRDVYKTGMSAKDVIHAVNEVRETAHGRT